MRDWLALPINANAGGNSAKNIGDGSDEGIILDQDDYRCDGMHKNKSIQVKNKGLGEELPTWLSVLKLFGITTDIQKKSSRSSSASPSSNKKTREPKPRIEQEPEIDASNDEIIANDFEQQCHNNEHDEVTHMQRTLSSSSIASSTDTDNSTPASSEIMRLSTPSKYYHAMAMSETSNVKICWNHGGKKVQVTGEFDNWSVSVDLEQDTDKPHCHFAEVPMDLSRDIEFKFIVDGEWRYANDLPHRTDWRGNINNVVYKKENLTATN
ncbi:hypothetical protein [Parasitella parasitica]|uniref:AMP-activated protein kinase glycogen-binding domain-containing protein n=1 Tax=Parasitella parasitica TaxID=35722 RepID=A0A0B7N7F0_9FUNG|nr:hypothetical protein [Parasitella parasitica]